MCGLAGIYDPASASSALLLTMAGELAHRGPDGVGLYHDGRFGMVNTRLAIVDLAGGDQPLGDETGRYWAMQNGEIYNYLELRDELTRQGHHFATTSDTEVLVHAFEAWGVDFLAKLNGDFAVAIWDRQTRELFLARDRFGVRPLFLSSFGGGLEFASEIKALLRHPSAGRSFDALALTETFTLWSTLPDRSSFLGVRELPPGHFLRFGPHGLIEEKCWWTVPFAAPDETRRESEADLAAELLELLRDATRLRLRADVPVGAYLSGGLDSSIIGTLTRDLTTGSRASFAVGFSDPRFDEGPFQDRIAAELGTRLSRLSVTGADIAEAFPEVVRLAERPLLRTAPAPLLALSRHARRAGFKVVLTGEGADELFGGYDIFKEAHLRRFWARQPDSALRPLLFRRLYPYLADLGKSGPFLQHFFGQGLSETADPLYSHLIRFNTTRRCLRFMTPAFRAEAALQGDARTRLRASLPAGFEHLSHLSRAQVLEIQTFLHGYLLHAQGDRMLMGGSVEGRFPFLDPRVAEFAARLPDRFKLRGLHEKYLLRKAVAGLLPKEIGRRTKRPYRAPIAAAFVGREAPEYVRELLSPPALTAAGIFDPAAVAQLLRKAEKTPAGLGETDEMALVGIVSTGLLHEQLIRAPVLAAPAHPSRLVVGSTVCAVASPVNGVAA